MPQKTYTVAAVAAPQKSACNHYAPACKAHIALSPLQGLPWHPDAHVVNALAKALTRLIAGQVRPSC